MVNTYKVGDYVTFYSSTGITNLSLGGEVNSEGDLVFDSCDVSPSMLKLIDGTYDAKIKYIDTDGDLKFHDFPYTWPSEIVSGYSHNHVKEV